MTFGSLESTVASAPHLAQPRGRCKQPGRSFQTWPRFSICHHRVQLNSAASSTQFRVHQSGKSFIKQLSGATETSANSDAIKRHPALEPSSSNTEDAMSSKGPQVAWFGVHWQDPMVPDHAKAGLKHTLEDVAAKCRSETGADLVFVSEPGQDIEAVRKTLASQHWDAALIGFGMRSIPGLTIYFEQVVNAVHELAPKAKFLFNTSLEDSLDAVKRLQSHP